MPHRLMILLLCAALLTCALPAGASATLYACPDGESCRLIDERGRVMADEGWQHIETLRAPSGQRRFVALAYTGDVSRATLLDEQGQPLTDLDYDYIYELDGELIATRGALMGVLSWDGEVILPVRYASIVPTGEGTYLTTTLTPGGSIAAELYLTSADGSSTYLGDNAVCAGSFSEGLLVAQSPAGLQGYLNTSGQWAIAPVYDRAEEFRGGRAVVARAGLYGLIDSSGSAILPARYDSIAVADIYGGDSGVTVALADGVATLYSSATLVPTRTVSGVDYIYLPGCDLAVLAGAQAREVYSADGRLLMRLEGDALLSILSATRAMVMPQDGSSARLIDLTSGEILALIEDVCDAYALTGDAGAWGICVALAGGAGGEMRFGIRDLDGGEILPAHYDSISQSGEGVYAVQRGRSFGLMRAGGEWILRPEGDG